MIKSAEAAAPAAVSSWALTIYAMDDKGAMRTLREGTNGWWRMPDTSVSPGDLTATLGDANAMEWATAMVASKEPPAGKIGFSYMLAGGSDGEAIPIPSRWSRHQDFDAVARDASSAPPKQQTVTDAEPDTLQALCDVCRTRPTCI